LEEELESMWMELVMPRFTVLYQYLLGISDNIKKRISNNNGTWDISDTKYGY